MVDKKNEISRADFFKVAGAGASVLLGAAIGLNSFVEKTGIDIKIQKWREISALPPTPENQILKKAFLKFNATEIYARRKGWKLTAGAINRFLTGEGQPWNITDALLEILRDQFGNQSINALWSIFARDAIQTAFFDKKNFDSQPGRKKIIRKIIDNKPFDLSFDAAAKSNLSDDLWFSLYRFRLTADTRVTSSMMQPGRKWNYNLG